MIARLTPAEHQQERALLALAARIRSDVARIGNERHEEGRSRTGLADHAAPTLAEAA